MIENSLKSYKNKCFECLCNIFYDLSTVYILIMSMVGQAHRDICSFTTISMYKPDRLQGKPRLGFSGKSTQTNQNRIDNKIPFSNILFIRFISSWLEHIFFIFFFQNLKIAQHILFYIFLQ